MKQDHPVIDNDSDPLDVAAWQLRYESNQIGWDRGAPSPALMHWLASDELPPCHVVVPGCGYGHEVIELARRGFRVTAIDFAERPIRSLKERLAREGLTATVHQTDVFRTQLAESADVVYEQTCLCAIAPAQRRQYVQQLGRWLGPGGRILAAFMQCEQRAGSTPPFHCDLKEMRALFARDEWQWPSQPPQRIDHPAGIHELAVILTKTS